MKYLIVLILSFSANANFIKKEKIGICKNVHTFSSALKCQGDCIKVPVDYNCETHVIEKKKVDNLESPIYSKNQINKCGEYCETLFPDLVCEDTEETPILNTDLEEIYCTKITGYDQTESDEDIVVVDEKKKATYEASELAKANDELAMSMASLAMECGTRVMQRLVVINASKSLTTTQLSSLLARYAPIKAMLDTGSLVTAREAIVAEEVDDILTEENKQALITELDACSP